MKNTVNTASVCCCGSGLSVDVCCARWHAGEAAPTAEALMRSRYAAFVACNENYLLTTWQSNTRPISIAFDSKQKWLGLKIVRAINTGADKAEVEFVARYRIGGGSAARLHELSHFKKERDRWYYVGGDTGN
jgi:SEC-C motif-containing protein